MEDLIYKNMSEISDMSDEGIITGYANVYNVKDLQGDISAFGSFAKTVTERKNKIKIFKNHNDSQLVGIPVEMDIADPYGLKISVKMLMDTELGRDAYKEVKFLNENGFESGMSIGGWVMKRNDKNKAEIQEYKLKEISLLTTSDPANPFSVVSAVKAINELEQMKQDDFWKIIEKAYNEKFSDNILKSLETFMILKDSEPDSVKADTIPDIQPSGVLVDLYRIYTNK